MDIQAAGINSFYVYQSALGQGPDLISSSPGSGSRIQDTRGNEALPRPDGEKQVDSASQAQEDEAVQKEGRPPASDEASMLTPDEKLLVEKLKKADSEVRAHEMAHIAAGSEYITSGATFSYQKGPDGKNYAVGGEVSIDTSPEPGDPEATLQKMRRVRAAALAPAQPSSQDLKVASNAASQAAKAMAEITQLMADEQAKQMEPAVSDYTRQQVSDAYTKTGSIPNQEAPNSFHIAV
ncbi:putative metalloprotease CJM1_0395 family protein [Desulfobacter curvatus]|uniref:putative metalloprotease CJM1_0395 family protein n=1 Tax=Desulfobacter curvatus TaxID=2290 RepID=UPI00035DC444|nr:putative metalloprotease CJM1_0395 family protein [Desulfobacter curvatus]